MDAPPTLRRAMLAAALVLAAGALALALPARSSAAPLLVNPGFENGSLSGWSTFIPFGGFIVVDSPGAPDGGGSFHARLKTNGPGSFTRLFQSFPASAGDVITGAAFFLNAENFFDACFGPFNDRADVRIFFGGSVFTVFARTSCGTVTGAEPFGWGTWSFTVPTTGVYTVEARVSNFGDSIVDSQLRFDVFTPDTTPPLISPLVTGQLGDGGWFTGDVTVGWGVADPESAITAQSGCGVSSVTSDTEGITFTCTATSAGGTASQSVTIRRDSTPPIVTATRTPPPNAFGWNNTDVTARFEATDRLSGIDGASFFDVVFTEEGENQGAQRAFRDRAGNVGVGSIGGINIDKTPPTVTFGPQSPAPNAFGWNNTDVSFAYEATDGLSGIADATPPSPVVVTGEGRGLTTTVTATDKAGNVTAAGTPAVDIDRTPPTISASVSGRQNAASWWLPGAVVSFECADALAGIASCPKAVTLATPGIHTVSGSAVDRADNSAGTSIEVRVARLVVIDNKPGSDPNSYGCRAAGGDLPVAILSSADFDATTVDASSVRAGRTGIEAAETHRARDGSAKRHVEDVNGDGLVDLVFHFRFGDTGFSCADLGGQHAATLTLTLTGIAGGIGIHGEDSLRLVGDG